MSPWQRRKRRWLGLAVLLFCGWWLLGWIAAYAATQPHPVPIHARTSIAGRPVEDVAALTLDGLTVRGWLVETPAESSADAPMTRAVILCAGIRGNRQGMVTRAEFYLQLGWSVLLVDLRGTGSSDRARISMGWHEALDLLAWHELLRTRGYQEIGVHGQSLGAAAAAYSSVRTEQPPTWRFLVLEACYCDIEAALRARVFGLPRLLLWPMLVCAEMLADVRAIDLNPVASLLLQTAPIFVACGANDLKVGPDATARLLAASRAVDKVRHDVADVGHTDLWSHGGEALRTALREFLSRR